MSYFKIVPVGINELKPETDEIISYLINSLFALGWIIFSNRDFTLQ